MPAKSKNASSSTSGGLFVRITLGDTQGRVIMNSLGKLFCSNSKIFNILLVWVESFTSADELCSHSVFERGSVSYVVSILVFNKFLQVVLIPIDGIRPKSCPPSNASPAYTITAKQLQYKKIASGNN